jgi:hypothetical protein
MCHNAFLALSKALTAWSLASGNLLPYWINPTQFAVLSDPDSDSDLESLKLSDSSAFLADP